MEKEAQRKLARAARSRLTVEERERFSREICRRLTEIPAVQAASIIFSYLAMGEEVELSALHGWAMERGKTLAFPVIGDNGRMEAFAPAGKDALGTGRFGIVSPVPAKSRLVLPEEIDLVLAPCVAFDASGGRLGMGGGYYDRYLPRCCSALRLGAAFQCQFLPSVAAEGHDTALDMVVTESGTYYFSQNRGL